MSRYICVAKFDNSNKTLSGGVMSCVNQFLLCVTFVQHFNIIPNEIVKKKSIETGYRMNTKSILCYADDTALFAENEDDLQRFLYTFNKATQKFNMAISREKN